MQMSHAPHHIVLDEVERASVLRRIQTFLGHHDLRIYVTDRAWIDVGRGSFDAALRMVHVAQDFEGCVGRVGQFCNFAQDCQLLGGGNHRNELPVNIVFYDVPVLGTMSNQMAHLRPEPSTPFEIGNAVVVSGRAMVLSGAKVGDGAVIAANAVVSGEVGRFMVCGGIPAKPLMQRFDAQRQAQVAETHWWDFDMPYLANNLARIQELALQQTGHVYRRPTRRLALKLIQVGASWEVQILGSVDAEGAAMEPFSALPEAVKKYIVNLNGQGPYYWLADMWTA